MIKMTLENLTFEEVAAIYRPQGYKIKKITSQTIAVENVEIANRIRALDHALRSPSTTSIKGDEV